MGVIYEPSGRAEEFAHLAVNLYVGCEHGCDYCFVPDFMHISKNDFQVKVSVRQNVLHRLKLDAPNYAGTDKRVLLCFSCDPYQPFDDEKKTTREAIKILKANNIPFQILTKGGMRAARDFDLYGPDDLFGTTLTLLDKDKSEIHEWKAAPPEERIASLYAAKSRGIGTFVSCEPVFEPAVTLEIIRQTHTVVDQYRIGKMNHQKETVSAQAWRRFGIAAIQLCREFKMDYYIKADLAKYLDGVHFYNTDKRKVKR